MKTYLMLLELSPSDLQNNIKAAFRKLPLQHFTFINQTPSMFYIGHLVFLVLFKPSSSINGKMFYLK